MAVTVLQLSDTHLGAEAGEHVNGRDPDERLARVLAAWTATGEPADLVLLTGDNTDAGSASGCARLADAVGALGAPVLAIAGNHDVPAVVADVFGGAEVAELEGWRVIGVDTTVPGQVHGAIDVAATLAHLDALDDRPTVLALHHPPISRSTHPQFGLVGSDALLQGLAERPHVRAIVAGHLHDAVELVAPTGLPVLGCPSTLLAITHHGDDMELPSDAPTGARILRLADDGTVTSEILEA